MLHCKKPRLNSWRTSSSREKQLPYFWAGTILVGKVDKFQKAGQFSWQAGITLGGFILLVGFILVNIIQRRKKRSQYKPFNPDIKYRRFYPFPDLSSHQYHRAFPEYHIATKSEQPPLSIYMLQHFEACH
jgi:hypothetical protein